MTIKYNYINNNTFNPCLFFNNYDNNNELENIKNENNNIILSSNFIDLKYISNNYKNIIIFSANNLDILDNFNNNKIFFINLDVDENNNDYENNIKKDIFNYSLSLIKKKGIDNILKLINNTIEENEKLFIYIDYNLILNNFFLKDNNIFSIFKNNKTSINIFNMQNIINDSIYDILQNLFSDKINENKAKKIKLKNIYNEDSRFIIFRNIKYNINDYGWYIARNLTDEMKKYLLQKTDNDNIITFNLNKENKEDNEEDEILITSTSINEQNEKSYFFTNNVFDCVLYPEEKISMLFELIN